ncbi:MAG TPA: hypothetical protein VFO16_08535 [Pseudonocardiaceae bacterium]|nr:hypothetical protein [Pseudonocardiaceae bacterium]
MSDALCFAEIAGQYVELLPARTLMSLVGAGGEAGTPGEGGSGIPGNGYNDNGAEHHVGTDSQGIPGAPGSANPGS